MYEISPKCMKIISRHYIQLCFDLINEIIENASVNLLQQSKHLHFPVQILNTYSRFVLFSNFKFFIANVHTYITKIIQILCKLEWSKDLVIVHLIP